MKRLLITLFLLSTGYLSAQAHWLGTRYSSNLENWKSVAHDTDPNAYKGFEQPGYDDSNWKNVKVPHNWDDYEGYRQLRHGNRHGYTWYRTNLPIHIEKGRRNFLYFQGVGSYATVYLNGKKVGYHAGGRTTFTIDITDAAIQGTNVLAVRADHPAMIADLPWVCGGCSGEWGFSEGSQPMGIFRPVSLVNTNEVRIEPFGVHVWNDNTITEKEADLFVDTEIKNYGKTVRKITVQNSIGSQSVKSECELEPGETITVRQQIRGIKDPKLWSPEHPNMTPVHTRIEENGKCIDSEYTPYGIRWISWHLNRDDGSNQFKINGKPVLINGTCEYEHLMGNSHAFTPEQIKARVAQMRAAGFNAFRDAHQPHNLEYNKYWDMTGMLWWSQMSAHIWYDTPEFRENFKQLLRDFVKERRNSPSLIMWGLQNESTLPTDFAEECSDIIRELDPTSSSQRLITTCNGGTGTDWNVVQNWSGTYGGNPYNYANEISKQLLNGEYGAWRSIDLHTEGEYEQNGVQSEDRMTLLMEMKIRQADSVKNKIAGQFHWLFNSHENPGRIQNGEGTRDMDKVGPVNYKGLVTPWGEPLDAYYMYRSNFVPKETAPMVYIVSHTWPDRWTSPGIKNGIRVFSNCDEVELFNGLNGESLGKKKREGGIGTHFIWNDVNITQNLLYAKGYVNGMPVASDKVILHHLPQGDGLTALIEGTDRNYTRPLSGANYIYRVNCGGDTYTDQNGSVWQADRHLTTPGTWGSRSWADDFPGIPPFFGSQRRTNDMITNSKEWPLFQSFRYGTDKLNWEFPVPDGDYMVELYFIEPWYGRDRSMSCSGWRVFDVDVNGQQLAIDLWKSVRANTVLKRSINTKAVDGKIKVSFPNTPVGQAVISAIAISTKDQSVKGASPSPSLAEIRRGKGWEWHSWMDTGDRQYGDRTVQFAHLPSYLHGGEWFRRSGKQAEQTIIELTDKANVYLLIPEGTPLPKKFSAYKKSADSVVNGKNEIFTVYTYAAARGETVSIDTKDDALANIVMNYIPKMGEEPSARPIVTLEAEKAALTGAYETGNFRKSDYVKLTGAQSTIEWEVNPGLAATYLIRFRYMNRLDKPIPMQIELINANNGVLMRSEKIDFPPAAEKWRVMSTTTGSMINAGLYKIRLTVLDTPGLELDNIEFE